jgi:hypothetical protein
MALAFLPAFLFHFTCDWRQSNEASDHTIGYHGTHGWWMRAFMATALELGYEGFLEAGISMPS